jgi:hypothetical protein
MFFITPIAKYGVKWWNIPGKLAFTVLCITVLIVPLSIDWRSLTSKTRHVQRHIIERIKRRRPTPQSGHEIFENKNPQCFSGNKIYVPFSFVIFSYEQYRLISDRSDSTEPRAIFWITFSSNYKKKIFQKFKYQSLVFVFYFNYSMC